MADPSHDLLPDGPADGASDPIDIGKRVRELRAARRWTLEEASRHTGLARSTLSKIERNQMSPTFDVLQRLARGLGVDLTEVFATREPSATARLSITRRGRGHPHADEHYAHEFLCTDLAHKRMLTFTSRVLARSVQAFDALARHEGEEFLYVLEGTVTLHTEFYKPVTLDAGDSVYYDSRMGHACVSAGEADALVLWVCTN